MFIIALWQAPDLWHTEWLTHSTMVIPVTCMGVSSNHRLLLVSRLEKQGDGSINFFYKGPDGEVKSMNAGLVLFGTGRKPIVWDMGLEVCTSIPKQALSAMLCVPQTVLLGTGK